MLRNRSLKAGYLELQAGLEAAEIAVAEAKTRSTEGAENIWLRDRIAELPADSNIATVQRLVLDNELKASDAFSKYLTEILSSADDARQALSEQWASTRQSAAALAAELIDRYPPSHPIISQLHEACASLDEALNNPVPERPDAPELSEHNSTDITQEAEHLRAANDLLQQEMNKLRGELSQHTTNVEQADEQAEDLKALLQ